MVDDEEVETLRCRATRIDGTRYHIAEQTVERDVIPKITSRKPIAIFLLGMARHLVYKKIQELVNVHNIPEENIIRVKVDAISFISRENPIVESKVMGEWKHEKFSEDNIMMLESQPKSVVDFKNTFNPQNVFCKSGAGSGKTYEIVNNIAPNYDRKEVLIITPTNTTRNDYTALGFDCEVVQGFGFSQKLPSKKYKIKIFDEVGMFTPSDWNIMVSTIMRGDLVYAFGDFKQLKPVGCLYTCDSKFFHDMYFANHKVMNENMRNDFSKEYYASLMRTIDHKLGYEEVKKYQVSWEKADTIICHDNVTVNKYNEMMLNLKGMKFGDIGCKVICKTNTFKKHGMVNNLELIVEKKDEKFVYFTNGTKIAAKLFKQDSTHFLPAYARTIYSVQGKSLESFHYAAEDSKWLIGDVLYTVISRLKTK